MFGILSITVVGGVVGSLLARRYPTMSRQQLFATVMAILGAVMVIGRPGGNDTAWFYVAATIAVSMGTFLVMVLTRRWNSPAT